MNASAPELGTSAATDSERAQLHGVRARARAMLTAELLDIARRHLAESGAAALSVRAVARDAGLASSAVYRYFPSRDALLTSLIVDAYNSLGQFVESAERAVPRRDLFGRWSATANSVRIWARDHRHEYALIYGSPVPGYQAPTDTIEPAQRVARVLVELLFDLSSGPYDIAPLRRVRPELIDDARALLVRLGAPPTLNEELLLRGLALWTHLFGAVSFELFGHFHNVIEHFDAYFERQIELLAREFIGLERHRPITSERRSLAATRLRSP